MSHPVALGWKDLNLLKKYTHGFSNFSFLECILLWMSIQCNVKDYAKVLTKFSCPGPSSSPDSKGLTAVQEVEQLREKVYASLEEYCKTQYPDEPGRFAKLLLRLPALRSIGLKCLEHLFFFKLIGNQPIDTFLMEMLEDPTPTSA